MPSEVFNEAASFLSNPSNTSSLPKISNDLKLELYGLYKLLTMSAEPEGTRPSIFFQVDRTKYDAWKSAGMTWQGREPEAEARYMEIAQSLGWTPGVEAGPAPEAPVEKTAEELLAEDSDEVNVSSGIGNGMGPCVSIMKRDEEDEEEQSLHSIAIDGDVQKLEAYLESYPDIDVNAVDDYGYTALHLACDRGNAAIVELLLRKGADASLKDSDELSALDLARESNHEDIATMLENYSRTK